MTLKQFVPSEVCLQCNGCCRYKEADSIWRPKVGQDEQIGLAAGYIKTIKTHTEHCCRFLNGGDNTCGIYTKRPFECSLYPFIISKTPDAVEVYAHLSCPYVQDYLPHADFDAYVAYLKEFLSRAKTKDFLSRNKAMFHDYSPHAPELLHVFDLSFL